MFLNFKISNYRSIGQTITVDFAISDSQKIQAFSEQNGKAANNIACIVGPNASGKTNILKGIVLFIQYVCGSYSNPALREPRLFRTHFCCTNAPTEFSTEFIDGECQYKYEISIFNGEVHKEILSIMNKDTNRYNMVFKREIGKSIQHEDIAINEQDLSRLQNDTSLMSLLMSLNYFQKDQFKTLKKFLTNVHPANYFNATDILSRLDKMTKALQTDKLMYEELVEELKNIDTGISQIKFDKINISPDKEVSTIIANHKINNQVFPLFILDESSGTLNYMELFTYLYKILMDGGLLIADELEQSLHPDITNRIIRRFLNKNTNPNNAQILFTTHNPLFLQDLTKTQIFISEKDDKGETSLTRLDDIQGVRNDENYFLKYLAGEYDGRPRIKDL